MKLKVGDVFTIPTDDKRIGIGQIINIPDRSTIIIAVYNKLWFKEAMPSLQELQSTNILFLGYTMDAKLYHKHWLIIGNYKDNLSSIYLPYHKLGTPPDDIFIVNYKGDKIRPATITEFNNLEYQTIVSPIRYENGLKANFNLGEWNDEYDELLYSHTLDSVKLVNDGSSNLSVVSSKRSK